MNFLFDVKTYEEEPSRDHVDDVNIAPARDHLSIYGLDTCSAVEQAEQCHSDDGVSVDRLIGTPAEI